MPLDENEGIYVRDIKTGKVGFSTYQISDSMFLRIFSTIILQKLHQKLHLSRYGRDSS